LLVEQNDKAALNLAKRAIVLRTGEIVLQGPATDLLADPKVKQAYLDGSITAEKNDLKISEIPNCIATFFLDTYRAFLYSSSFAPTMYTVYD
jgi:hypothetical protein